MEPGLMSQSGIKLIPKHSLMFVAAYVVAIVHGDASDHVPEKRAPPFTIQLHPFWRFFNPYTSPKLTIHC